MKCFVYIISFNLHNNLKKCHFYSYFTGEENSKIQAQNSDLKFKSISLWIQSSFSQLLYVTTFQRRRNDIYSLSTPVDSYDKMR